MEAAAGVGDMAALRPAQHNANADIPAAATRALVQLFRNDRFDAEKGKHKPLDMRDLAEYQVCRTMRQVHSTERHYCLCTYVNAMCMGLHSIGVHRTDWNAVSLIERPIWASTVAQLHAPVCAKLRPLAVQCVKIKLSDSGPAVTLAGGHCCGGSNGAGTHC